MKQIPRNLSRIFMAMLVVIIALGGATSCKSTKKLAAEQAAAGYAKKVDQAKKDLNAIINGTTGWPVDQQRQRVKNIKAENFNDPEVQKLITLAEKEIDMQQAELDRKAEEERLKREEEAKKRANQSKYAVFDNQFESIATAPGFDDANRQIDLALQQFESPDVPVLIIISQINGVNDYDKPTTAKQFLNLLKDTKKYKYKVETMKQNSLGKITEIEFLKIW
ncbi:MAG TPA: hypothetical protein ENH02_09005 [Bacteroidetes bacterium]|nr:hypothetical protein [Bacteroidota bacterium]